MRALSDVLLGDDVVSIAPSRKKGGPGRKSVFTKQRRKEYLARRKAGDGAMLAAENVDGVSYRSVKRYMDAHPKFAAKCVEAAQKPHEVVENALFRKASSGDNVAMFFYLQNAMPEKYQDRRGPRMVQQMAGGGPSVEWTLAEARAEAHALIDEVKRKRLENLAKATGVELPAIEAESREADA